MYEINRRKSTILFVGLILIAFGLSLFAYSISGNMGIEERFNKAVGIETGPEEESSSGIYGFNIEGNSFYFTIIIVVLIILCLIIYIKNRNH